MLSPLAPGSWRRQHMHTIEIDTSAVASAALAVRPAAPHNRRTLMADNTNQETRNAAIIAAMEKVEHPAIATTLVDLGMLRDIQVNSEGLVSAVLVLPALNIPENIRNYMVNTLAAAAKEAGGTLDKIKLAVMNDQERQTFLAKERENWRG
jgi:metal-sulfur cluster biosynthetic enzyme